MEAWCVPGKSLTSVPYHRQFLWVLCFFSQIFLGKFSVTNNLQTLGGQQNQGFFILQVILQLGICSKSSAMFHLSCPLGSRLLWSPYLVLMAEGKMKWLELVIALKTSFQGLRCHFLWPGQGPWPCLEKARSSRREALHILLLSQEKDSRSLPGAMCLQCLPVRDAP